jgi:hypothetical protein
MAVAVVKLNGTEMCRLWKESGGLLPSGERWWLRGATRGDVAAELQANERIDSVKAQLEEHVQPINECIIPAFTSVDYSDEQAAEYVHGKGRRPVGYSKGNYSASGKISLYREAYEELLEFLSKSGISALYDMPPMGITVSYANDDSNKKPHTDVIEGVIYTKRGFAMKQNDTAASVELEFVCAKIIWNQRL